MPMMVNLICNFSSEDCNKDNNVFNFPGTFTRKLSDIISHGEYIGVVNCRDRAPIVCVDFDNCWKGEPNTRIALVPFCVDDQSCQVFIIICYHQIMCMFV